MEWLLILHNEINKSLGKPPITLEEAIKRYLGAPFLKCPAYEECRSMPDVSVQEGGVKIFQHLPPAGDKDDIKKKEEERAERGELVEGFSLNEKSYKDIMILVLIVVVIYLLYKSRIFR